MWPREDVDELGQLVERGAAQEPPDPRAPVGALDAAGADGLAARGDRVQVNCRVGVHRGPARIERNLSMSKTRPS